MAGRKQETAPGYPPTPELDKMLAAKDRLHTEAIGEFVEWLREQGIVLARTHTHDDGCLDEDGRRSCGYLDGHLEYVHESLQCLLERYAEVDPAKMEQERRAVLEWWANRGEGDSRSLLAPKEG